LLTPIAGQGLYPLSNIFMQLVDYIFESIGFLETFLIYAYKFQAIYTWKAWRGLTLQKAK